MRQPALFSIILTILVITTLSGVVSADISIGAKKGDWIQYQVTEIGPPTPDYNITWARMDITAVQDERIIVDVKTGYANGTLYPEPNIALNLATGAIGDGFFIPANLNLGDQFCSKYQGNITITSVWQLNVAGATRTVVSATSNQTTYYWDKQTGILVAATTAFPNFTLFTKTSETNIWQPQILGLDSITFYVAITAVLIAVAIVVLLLVWRKKKNHF